jgi:hypothetical protein
LSLPYGLPLKIAAATNHHSLSRLPQERVQGEAVNVSLQEVVMERKERMLECPECREQMPAWLLNDLNKCDNCGCPAHYFEQDGGK